MYFLIAITRIPFLTLLLLLSLSPARSLAGPGIQSPALLLSPTLTATASDLQLGVGSSRGGALPGISLHAAATKPAAGDNDRGETATVPDLSGLRKDTFYFVFSQFFVIGILYALPEDISAWSEEQKEDYSFDKYRDNIRNIVWDEDRWYLNYILHPYWGGAYFVRARERGYSEDSAFWYSALLSAMYEYGAEALFENPSVQDLILTPGLGFFVGQYFMDVRNRIRARLGAGYELTVGDHAILIATDPLGAINKVFDRMFGIEGDYVFSPFMTTAPHQAAVPDDPFPTPSRVVVADSLVPGIQINMRW